MKRTLESKIQSDAVIWLRNNYGLKHHNPRIIMFQVPNETLMIIRGVLIQTRLTEKQINNITAVLSQKLTNTGLLPGVSDTIVVLPNKVLFVEFKTPDGTQQQNQKEFETIVTELGHEYHIIRSLEQFQNLIQCSIKNTN